MNAKNDKDAPNVAIVHCHSKHRERTVLAVAAALLGVILDSDAKTVVTTVEGTVKGVSSNILFLNVAEISGSFLTWSSALYRLH